MTVGLNALTSTRLPGAAKGRNFENFIFLLNYCSETALPARKKLNNIVKLCQLF